MGKSQVGFRDCGGCDFRARNVALRKIGKVILVQLVWFDFYGFLRFSFWLIDRSSTHDSWTDSCLWRSFSSDRGCAKRGILGPLVAHGDFVGDTCIGDGVATKAQVTPHLP